MLTRLTPMATLTDTKQQSATTSFSTQIERFRDICAMGVMHEYGVIPMSTVQRTIIRKKLPAKSNIFALNKIENIYSLFSSDY